MFVIFTSTLFPSSPCFLLRKTYPWLPGIKGLMSEISATRNRLQVDWRKGSSSQTFHKFSLDIRLNLKWGSQTEPGETSLDSCCLPASQNNMVFQGLNPLTLLFNCHCKAESTTERFVLLHFIWLTALFFDELNFGFH